MAKKLLQMFQTCDKKQFGNVVTGVENWVFYFEPVRKVSNKIWATKHSRRPIIAKPSLSAKWVWYAIFFSGEGVAIKVPVEKGKKHHQKVLQRHSTGEAGKNIRNNAMSLVLNISVLHGNVPAHASEIVMAFLKNENVTVLPHLPYSIDLALCDFFMLLNLK